MEEHFNYLGATIFWLYILAALAFTAIILKTLHDIPGSKDPQRTSHERQIKLFGTLAAISFNVLSYNMLNVLIQSYTLWARNHNLSLDDTSLNSIWRWSVTSTLFQDFGNAIVHNSARYLWVEASLLATLCVCFHIGIEGQHRDIPRLWAFTALGQILPVSFTQNLFYIALLRQPQPSQPWRISKITVVLLSGAYCACLIIAPFWAETEYLIPQILVARLLLVAMQTIPWTRNAIGQSEEMGPDVALLDREGLFQQLALVGTTCAFGQASLALLGQTPAGIARALFSHPAVSSLGCDLVLSAVSYLCWRSVSSIERQTSSGSN